MGVHVMRATVLFLPLALLSVAARSEQPAPRLPDDVLPRLVELYSDGVAQGLPELQRVQYGHFFEEESDDAIALFSLEGFGGGNEHGEYIAFFQGVEPYEANGERTRPYRMVATMQIGGRWWRTFDWKSLAIEPGVARISGKAWRTEDAGCCPSAPVTATFRLKDGRILESD